MATAIMLGMALLLPTHGWSQVARAQEGTPDGSEPVIATEEPVATEEIPTEEPVVEPTDEPVVVPTDEPTEEPVVEPTDIPTDEPSATLEPTSSPTDEPTATATATATPSPTPRPAKPFQPSLACTSLDGALAKAGGATWAIQECTATWDTENVSQVVAQVSTSTDGWALIAVNGGALSDQAQLDAATGTLTLADDTPDDGKFLSTRFYLGTRLSCTAITTAAVDVALTATSTEPVPEDDAGNPLPAADGSAAQPGAEHVETATTPLQIGGEAATDPTIAITGFSFTQVDQPASDESTGTITLSYANAPSGCGWQAQVTLSDFTSDLATVPISAMTLSSVAGTIDTTNAFADGVISIIAAPDPTAPTSGTLTITTKVTFPDTVPPGGYHIAVTVQATRLQ
ncbi:MAG: hypothetical protein ACTHQE_12580 [Thermomicrobiales bacterium]